MTQGMRPSRTSQWKIFMKLLELEGCISNENTNSRPKCGNLPHKDESTEISRNRTAAQGLEFKKQFIIEGGGKGRRRKKILQRK